MSVLQVYELKIFSNESHATLRSRARPFFRTHAQNTEACVYGIPYLFSGGGKPSFLGFELSPMLVAAARPLHACCT